MNANTNYKPQISTGSTNQSPFWKETRTTAKLAFPIIIGQVIQNSLSVIDTLMVGQVSVEAVAAASLATALFVVPLVFGFGLLGPFSVIISGAAARGDSAEAVHTLRRGLTLALALAVGIVLVITIMVPFLSLLHQPSAVLAQARSFLLLLTWSIVPMYLFQIIKQYCEALHTAVPPMAILATAVPINVFLNWIFIFGHLGFPTLGLIGAGWATLVTRLTCLSMLVIVVLRTHVTVPTLRREFFRGRFQWAGYRQLLALGLPAGAQVILEVGAFSTGAVMMGWLSEAALAAHQVAIAVASTTFMVPLGLAMAVAIRVSHAIGSGDLPRARRSIYGALSMTLAVMAATAAVILIFHSNLAKLFLTSGPVLVLAGHILIIAGLFQIFDGLQVVAAGALRGLHDVKIPTLTNLGGYWLLGLPLSYVLAFKFGIGPTGIWLGLLVGLAAVSGLLLIRLELVLKAMRDRNLIDTRD